MLVDVRIGRTRVTRDAACVRAGVWRFIVWSAQDVLLPFMRKTAAIPLYALKVDEITVNHIIYEEADSEAALSPGTFRQDGGTCLFIANGYDAPWALPVGFKVSILSGFTTGGTYLRDGMAYQGGLDYYPSIKETADNIEAAKMKFNTGTLTLDNTDGFFDDAWPFYGNTVQVFAREEGGPVLPLYEYYIKNIKATLKTAALTLADKRQRLSQKIPSEKYALDRYPFMQNPGNPEQKSSALGAIIADAYGLCVNIPAVCTDPFQVYEEGNGGPLKTYRTFKVCGKITRLDKVMVKMTQPSDDAGSKEVWTDQKALGHIRSVDYANGEFTMNTDYCMPEFTDYDVPEIFDVAVTGVFGLPEADCTPAKIIADIMLRYAGIPFTEKYYDTAACSAELAPLARIGIFLDKEQDIFKVIEQIQNGSTFSFQFVTEFDRFSAKRNDDGRAVKAAITRADILNPSAVEYDTNADEYATVIDVGYISNHLDGSSERLVNKDNRDEALYKHNIDKTYAVDTLLQSRADAETKVNSLAKYFSQSRPVISGITLYGTEWFGLRCYDTVDIDLRHFEEGDSLPLVVSDNFLAGEGGLRDVMGVENAGRLVFVTAGFGGGETERPFAGRIRGKITSVEKNTKDGTVKISVVKLEDIA
jgi:hypothetical protein